jgi:saccharopine dehydrogenase (NADP+, L-glutamate forming)
MANASFMKTLRYQSFPEFVKVLVDIGFLSDEGKNFLNEPIAWKEATQKILDATSTSEDDLLKAISPKTSFRDHDEKERLISGLRWLGIFSETKIIPKGSPLDTLCATLEEKMQYKEGERDFVILQHRFEIENSDGSKETKTSTLCEYDAPTGSGGYSAMAKLVGIPCGIAVKQVLDGIISLRGIIAPINSEIN